MLISFVRLSEELRTQAIQENLKRKTYQETIQETRVGNMLIKTFSFAPMEAKIQLFKSYYYPINGCALWHHSYQYSIRKLTVSYSDTFKRLINVPRYTSSSLAFAMNTSKCVHIRKSAFSLMS